MSGSSEARAESPGSRALIDVLSSGQSLTFRAARAGLLFLLAAAIYWVCLRCLFPGYFVPLTPNHADLYTPVGFLERSFAEVLTYPRPLTYVFLRTTGLLGVEGSILVVIVAAIAGVLLAASLTRRWAGCRLSWTGLICYLVLVFGHPEFYFEHRHDSPGVLSLVLALLAAECFRRWLVGSRWGPLAWCFALTFALGLVKETYYPSLLILLATLVVAERQWLWRRVLPAMAGVCALLALSFLISAAGFRRWIPAGAESYHISLASAEVWRGFVYYVSHLFTWASGLTVFASLAALVRTRQRWVIGGGMVLAGIAALLPNSVLPNHLFPQYAWLAAPFCFAPLLLMASSGSRREETRFRLVSAGAAIVLTALAVWSYLPQYASPVHEWDIAQERQNGAIMRSFPQLHRLPPGGRVLIAGVETPLSPWIEPDFLKHEFGAHEWTVVVPLDRPERELPGIHLVHAGDVQPAAFDHAFDYDENGNLRRELDHEALVAASRAQPAEVVVPQLVGPAEQLRRDPNDHTALLKAGEVCVSWGLEGLAEDYLRRSLEVAHDRDAYAFYFLGRLKERQKQWAEAYVDYQHAVEADQKPRNPLFQQAAERVWPLAR